MVYYRNTIPILYEGPLEAEDDLLEWLIQNRNSGDEEDVIEDVQFKSLEAMVAAVENIAVLFCEYSQLILKTRFTTMLISPDNPKSTKTNEILESLETIDDDCDSKGVHFVKIADPAAAYHYGITTLPTLVYFKNSVPNLFDGELSSQFSHSPLMVAAQRICTLGRTSQNLLQVRSEVSLSCRVSLCL